MQTHPSPSLIEQFKDLNDPRVDRTKEHELIDILIISLCCLLCGGESFNDMEDFGYAKQEWFKTFLKLRNGIPSHDTFNRLFSALDPKKFLECFLRWTQSVRQAVPQEIVALDGKALRRALNRNESPKYVVSAWGARLKVGEVSSTSCAIGGWRGARADLRFDPHVWTAKRLLPF